MLPQADSLAAAARLLPERRILVVDDVPEILDLVRALSRRIRDLRIHVTIEVNAQRAQALAAQQPFDLVLSDLRMREVDGLEVLRAARTRHPGGKRVLMTGYQQLPVSVERLRAADVDAILHKPLRTSELMALISAFLRHDPDVLTACRASARNLEQQGQSGYVMFQSHLAPLLAGGGSAGHGGRADASAP